MKKFILDFLKIGKTFNHQATHLPVQAAGPQQGRVYQVRPRGGSQDIYTWRGRYIISEKEKMIQYSKKRQKEKKAPKLGLKRNE